MVKKRSVIITGASRGLGAQLALEFALRGDKVIGLYKNERADAEEVTHKIEEEGGSCEMYQVDISQSVEVKKFFDNLERKIEGLDLLINNAAITRDELILRMHPNDWDEVLKVNLKGPFFCIKEAARIFGQTKVQEGRGIINIISLVGMIGGMGQTNYAASKAGLMALTRVAALELREYGVWVNAIIPGLLQTSMSEGTLAQSKHLARPLKEVAQGIYFISHLHGVTGQVFSLEDRVECYENMC